MEQISSKSWKIEPEFFAARLKRMTGYFKNLINSFEIMVEGMEPKQFLQFRMSLLPASGFQSAQYRSIEICATDFIRMVDKEYRDKILPMPLWMKNIKIFIGKLEQQN
jgi:tryptophan 2,3-dioxygenase